MANRAMAIESGLVLAPENPDIAELLLNLTRLHAVTPLVSFEFSRDAPLSTDYSYIITALDGRTWTQRIRWTDPLDTDPPQDFQNVAQFWRQSEFQYHRLIRDKIVEIKVKYDLTLLTTEWS